MALWPPGTPRLLIKGPFMSFKFCVARLFSGERDLLRFSPKYVHSNHRRCHLPFKIPPPQPVSSSFKESRETYWCCLVHTHTHTRTREQKHRAYVCVCIYREYISHKQLANYWVVGTCEYIIWRVRLKAFISLRLKSMWILTPNGPITKRVTENGERLPKANSCIFLFNIKILFLSFHSRLCVPLY